MAVRKVKPGWFLWFEGLGSTEVWCADTYEEAAEFQPKKLGPWQGQKRIMRVYFQPHRTSEGVDRVFTRDKMEVSQGPETNEQFQERMSIQTQLKEAEKEQRRKEREA